MQASRVEVTAKLEIYMPRYFFDIHDGVDLTIDDVGVICETEKEVRDQAIKVLPEMAIDELPDGPEHLFWVKVRDADGQCVFHASLQLKSGWLEAK